MTESCTGTSTACPADAVAEARTACGASATCVDGTFTPGGTCDGQGGCTAGTPVACDSGVCDAAGTACLPLTLTCGGYCAPAFGADCPPPAACSDAFNGTCQAPA